MILFLLCFLLNYDLLKCYEDRRAQFNESVLMDHHHKNILQVNAVFRGFHTKRSREKSLLRTGEPDQEFMDYSITNVWWNSTPGIHQTDRITPQYSFFPTPIGHGRFPGEKYTDYPYNPPKEPTIPKELQDIVPPFPSFPLPPGYPPDSTVPNPFVTRPEFPFPVPTPSTSSAYPPHIAPYEPLHPQYPGLTLPPGAPTDYKFPTIYPPEPGIGDMLYSKKYTGSTPKRPAFPVTEFSSRPTLTYPVMTYGPLPTLYPEGSDPELFWTSPPPETPPEIFTYASRTLHPTIQEYVKDWMLEIAKTRHNESYLYTMPNIMTYTTKESSYLPPFERTRPTTNGDRNLKDHVSKDHHVPMHYEKTTKLLTPTKFSDFHKISWNPTKAVKSILDSGHLIDDHYGFVFPEKASDVNQHTKTTTEGMIDRPTTAGDALYGHFTVQPPTVYTNHPTVYTKHPHDILVQDLNENHMVVFLLELTRLIVFKNKTDVHYVTANAENIFEFFHQNNQLLWVGQPLLDVSKKLAKFITDSEPDVIQSHASILHNVLRQRKQELSEEANAMIDYADSLYEEADWRRLFDVLEEFERFPNTSKCGYWLCNSFFDEFLRPYLRLKHTQRLQNLLDSVNRILRKNFPQYTYKDGPFRVGRVELKSRAKRESSYESSNSYSREREKNKNRRRNRKHLKRRHRDHRDIEYSNDNSYRRHYKQLDYEYPALRSMKPIIKEIQRRYSIVTSKYHSMNKRIRSDAPAYFFNLLTRPTKAGPLSGRNVESNHKTDFLFPYFHKNHDVDRDYYRRKLENSRRYRNINKADESTAFYHKMKEKFKESKVKNKGSIPTNVLRKIVESSSYSDEEESLKMNLIQALLSGQRNFEIGFKTTAQRDS